MTDKDKIYEAFQDFLKKGKVNPLKTGLDSLIHFFLFYLNQIGAKISDFTQSIDEIGGWSAFFSEAWNFEEIKIDEYTFAACIQWLKKHMDKTKYGAGCLLKLDEQTSLKKDIEYPLQFHLCFLDHNNNPLLDGDAPHVYIHTKKLDSDLAASLADKPMLIIK